MMTEIPFQWRWALPLIRDRTSLSEPTSVRYFEHLRLSSFLLWAPVRSSAQEINKSLESWKILSPLRAVKSRSLLDRRRELERTKRKMPKFYDSRQKKWRRWEGRGKKEKASCHRRHRVRRLRKRDGETKKWYILEDSWNGIRSQIEQNHLRHICDCNFPSLKVVMIQEHKWNSEPNNSSGCKNINIR